MSAPRIARVRAVRVAATMDAPFATPFGAVDRREAVLVEVVDTDGAVGWGECGGPASIVEPAVADLLAPVVLGADARDCRGVWQSLWAAVQPWGRRGAVVGALSGCDMALWDLAARRMGCPAASLFGGILRDRFPCAAPALNNGNGPETGRIPRMVDEAAELFEQGYRALSVHLGRNLAHDRAVVRGLRKAMPDRAFTAHGHGAYDLPEALAIARVLEDEGFSVFEEALSPDHPHLYTRLAAHARIPLSAGRFLQTRHDVRDLLDAGGVSIVHVDAAWCGGPTEAGRIRSLATAEGINATPVGGITAIGFAAMMHFLASDVRQPGRVDVPPQLLRRHGGVELLRDRIAPGCFSFEDGIARLPSGDGWGVVPDPDALRAHTVSVREVGA
ncbi:MAG: mandelate racemase/muconate lactonizing enzyme family protein [Armatimonadota bacterium]